MLGIALALRRAASARACARRCAIGCVCLSDMPHEGAHVCGG